ncbi:unnamed protein product [Zymoseptoria tritici ST99CH_1E4]|uniref:Uncharacterized protein n=1 Tax=Zymoseptoria tritici ST99CH_1E4 TaxID=1276532 RepID=A0A2H1GQA1_ZYMTR|nr:unnamed protein product [Zymoseptoria tritici ST99CH_1E4]
MNDTPAPSSTSRSAKMRNDSQVFEAPVSASRDIISGFNKAKYDLASSKNFSKKSRRPFKRTPPPQSAAFLKFFSTPELCEKALLYRQPEHLINAKQVSHEINNTIIGSIKLQRALFRKPDHRLVTGQAVERDIPERNVSTRELKAIRAARSIHPGPLLRANPWLFLSAYGQRQAGLLCISNLMRELIRNGTAVEPFLGNMFITQPPIEHVEVECYYRPRGRPGDGSATSHWKCVVPGGIKVENLVEHIQRKLRASAEGLEKIMDSPTAHIITIGLRDGYEVCEDR